MIASKPSTASRFSKESSIQTTVIPSTDTASSSINEYGVVMMPSWLEPDVLKPKTQVKPSPARRSPTRQSKSPVGDRPKSRSISPGRRRELVGLGAPSSLTEESAALLKGDHRLLASKHQREIVEEKAAARKEAALRKKPVPPGGNPPSTTPKAAGTPHGKSLKAAAIAAAVMGGSSHDVLDAVDKLAADTPSAPAPSAPSLGTQTAVDSDPPINRLVIEPRAELLVEEIIIRVVYNHAKFGFRNEMLAVRLHLPAASHSLSSVTVLSMRMTADPRNEDGGGAGRNLAGVHMRAR